jgi:Aldo/keto reductase family
VISTLNSLIRGASDFKFFPLRTRSSVPDGAGDGHGRHALVAAQARLPVGQVPPRQRRFGRYQAHRHGRAGRAKDYVVIEVLRAVADEVSATPATVALAWVRSRPGVASTLIGARRPDQLGANLTALDLILTDAQIAKLSEASKPALNFPADINTHLAPMYGFPGTTIDGQTVPASSMLAASATRY